MSVATCERLAIGDLRRAGVGFDAVGALQDVDLDVEMKLAHALQDRLARLRIDRNAERRIFERQRVQRDRHLFLIGLRLRLDLHFDDRVQGSPSSRE